MTLPFVIIMCAVDLSVKKSVEPVALMYLHLDALSCFSCCYKQNFKAKWCLVGCRSYPRTSYFCFFCWQNS